jgi:acyl-CoA synthetase (AMP-forming)/AMP-acid ligase II
MSTQKDRSHGLDGFDVTAKSDIISFRKRKPEERRVMILEVLEGGAADKIAVTVSGGPSVTYADLRKQVDDLVLQLNRLGLGRGDRIGIALGNGLEMVASFLAAATAGTAAPLNPAYKYDEFKFYLEDTRAKALIVPPLELPEARRAAEEAGIQIIEASTDSQGRVVFSSSRMAVASMSSRYPDDHDIALMLHTSGTTSRPKRVPLTHGNLLTSARNVSRWYGLGPEDIALCVMPLFHVHGLVASTLSTLKAGGTVAVIPKFNPLAFWPAVKEHRATWYSAVPTIHQVLLARSRKGSRPQGVEHLRFIRSCSAPLAPQTMADMEERFGIPVVEAYGMTEAAHQMASNALPPGIRKPGSVGTGTSVEIAILDESGSILAEGERGEVCIKGPNVFGGYEDNPEANKAAFTNGWFRTGDQGFMDENGYVTLVGRIKELINRGGEKISPREVDEALQCHPAVAEAVCFGIADRVYGEEVAAAVVPKSQVTEAELIKHCAALLADFKVPRVIHIVEAIPRTATGKVQRRIVASELNKPRQR